MNKKIIIILFMIGVTFVYWEYYHVSCSKEVGQALHDHTMSMLDAQRFYEVGYKVCMGKRGL